MHIVERRPGGYLIECTCARGGTFFQRSPILSVECPHCGQTAPAADLVTAWVIAERATAGERTEAAD